MKKTLLSFIAGIAVATIVYVVIALIGGPDSEQQTETEPVEDKGPTIIYVE